jgi:serine phosphatase RsbU (regulator of sigma subunit)
MKNRLIVGFIWILIIYVIGDWAFNIYEPLTMLSDIADISRLDTAVAKDSTSHAYLFEEINTTEFEGRITPIVGDTLLSIRNESVSDTIVTNVFDENHAAGDTVAVTIGSSLGRHDTLIKYQKKSFSTTMIILLFQAMFPIPFFFVAIWAMVKRGMNAGVRVLSLLLLSLSVIFIISIQGTAIGIRAGIEGTDAQLVANTYQYAWYNMPAFILASVNTGFWFHLAFLFPSPSVFMRKYPWIIYLFAYITNLVFAILLLNAPIASAENGITPVHIISSVFGIIQILFGLGVFIYRGIKTKSPLEKRQIKVLLQSVGLGLVIMFISATTMLLLVLKDQINVVGVLISFIGLILGLMMIPLGFAYSFSKYRLLEVEGKLKRGMVFILTSGGLLVLVLVVFYIATSIVINRYGWENKSAIVFFTLVLVMAYVPVHNLLQKRIEKRIFRTRWKLREMLENFLEITSSLPDRTRLWEEFGKRLQDNIGVRTMHVFLLDPTKRQFRRLNGDTVALPEDGALQLELSKKVRALMVEELEGSNEIIVSAQEKEWLDDLGATVLVPIQIHKDLVGIMALEFEYGYDEIKAGELDILVSITTRVALENENLRLLEDNIEKQRLEEQLATARQVQQQFLPESLPDTPGLQISAHCSFCLEVAGDTFDVIPMDDQNTLFAVGDVSGKGAGAAMIMANVQASLRALTNTGLPLSTMIAKINTLIAQSTSPEQFITYFAAIYNRSARTITYVNAGHNPPRIVRKNGDVVELTEGGLILGIMADVPYEQAELPFESGDVLVAFTDGISEATDPSGEMYEEERIVEVVSKHRHEHPETIFTNLIQDLDTYRQDTPLDDDVTIFIARAE